jgi:hypothetical protein
MKRNHWFILALLLTWFSASSYAQTWSPILNPLTADQKNVSQAGIDWSNTGVPGGVPSRTWTQCGPTVQASTFGNGSSDATSAIQAALNGCGANQFVLLSAGTFLVNSAGAGSPTISILDNRVLRGSGASKTILTSNGTNFGSIIDVGRVADPGSNYGTNSPVTNSVNITSGATAGSTSIVVSSAANFTVGGDAVIQETNDPTYVTKVGGSDTCTYCDGFWNGDRSRGQIVEITSITGTTIGITPALYTAYTLTPQALPFQPTKHAGVEALQIVSNNTHTSQNNEPIRMYSCAYCWVQGVEENYTDGDYVKVYWGYRDEIRDSYFTNGFNHGPGQNNNSVWFGFKTTASKIENNIMERCENPVMLQFGAAGNVIAYNYATGCWGVPSTITTSFEWHAAHLQFNLLEGNVGPAFWLDVGHGSTSETTTFRNWWLGSSFVCSPTNDTRAAVNCTGTNGIWSTDGSRAIGDDSLSVTSNFVGDIVGSAGQQGISNSNVAVIEWNSTRNYNGTQYGISFGYTLFGDPGTNSLDSTTAFATSFVHGVYNNINGSTTWSGSVTHTLPRSFYLSSVPPFWNTTPFPPIGPDITGGNGPGNHAFMIPAQACFYSTMGGAEGGAGGPLTFNPTSCYGVQPPTGVTATVH